MPNKKLYGGDRIMIGFYCVTTLNENNGELILLKRYALTKRGALKHVQHNKDMYNMWSNVYYFGALIQTNTYDNVIVKWSKHKKA
jgi:alpha-acetolactate decarboxylase